MKCCATQRPYKVLGYKGKQVRDNMHCSDLVRAFDLFFKEPRSGEVYNVGGSRFSNCSMLEAIAVCEEISGREMRWEYDPCNRVGDHIWWISDVGKFQSHYPEYKLRYNVRDILREINDRNRERWSAMRESVNA
jgi:CDP-paratose 2-epimerase